MVFMMMMTVAISAVSAMLAQAPASAAPLPDGTGPRPVVIWTYLSQLDIPVGLFHGEIDGNTPVAGVRGLERQAMAAGKTKFEFHYFAGEEHSLGGLDYFLRGGPSEGYKELFAYVKRQTGR